VSGAPPEPFRDGHCAAPWERGGVAWRSDGRAADHVPGRPV